MCEPFSRELSAAAITRNRLLIVEAQTITNPTTYFRTIDMRRSIGIFMLYFTVMVVLFAPGGFARDPNSVSICPPSLRMTEHDGCQPSNGSRSLSAHVKDDAAEQSRKAAEQLQKEIATLVNNSPPEVQSCVWFGSLGRDPIDTLNKAKAKILRCQNEEQAFALIKTAPSDIQSCVWRGSHDDWTQDKAHNEIKKCQNEKQEFEDKTQAEIEKRQQAMTIMRFIGGGALIAAGGLLLISLIRCRARISAGLYNLFVGYLALRLRLNRSRKRFLDNAIKEAEKRAL
jgi:hypothetical protein